MERAAPPQANMPPPPPPAAAAKLLALPLSLLPARRPKELRQLKAELGVLASADGSAMFEMGNTKVCGAEPAGCAVLSGQCAAAEPVCGHAAAIASVPASVWVTPATAAASHGARHTSHGLAARMQVLAAVFGPKPVETRSQEDDKRCLVKCEYAMASFSTGGSCCASFA